MRPRRLLLLLTALPIFATGPSCEGPQTADDLQALIDAAGLGGTVRIEGTYELCRRVQPIALQTWEGGGVLRRCPVARSRLVAPARAGDTTIVVEDARTFHTQGGNLLGLGEGERADGEGNGAHWILSKTGDTITFHEGLRRDHPVGTLVYETFPLVQVSVPGVTIRDLTIDGLRSFQPDYVAWDASTASVSLDQGNGLTLEDVTIVGAWGDGLHVLDSNWVRVRRVTFDDVRCGAIHAGHTHRLLVEDSTFRDVGTDAEACGHSEGAFTYSLENEDVTIARSCFENVGNPWGAVGRMYLPANEGLLLEENVVCGATYLLSARAEGPGEIEAIGNAAHVTGGQLFEAPGVTDLFIAYNSRIGPCTCGGP